MHIPGLDLLATEWMDQAICRGKNTELYFGAAVKQEGVKRQCKPCPVRRDCLNYAITRKIEEGVWGGLTGYERRKLLVGKPSNWTRYLLNLKG